jgi:hypothetical protein
MSPLASLQNTFSAAVLGLLLLSQPAQTVGEKECAAPQPEVDSTYRPGQVWSYNARPAEAASTVTILRVERTPKLGVIVHIRVDGVKFKNCTGGPSPSEIDHAPFTKAAMDKSVSRKLRTDAKLPDFAAGYDDWLAHCGGVYTLSIAEMVAVNDATFNAGLGCKA